MWIIKQVHIKWAESPFSLWTSWWNQNVEQVRLVETKEIRRPDKKQSRLWTPSSVRTYRRKTGRPLVSELHQERLTPRNRMCVSSVLWILSNWNKWNFLCRLWWIFVSVLLLLLSLIFDLTAEREDVCEAVAASVHMMAAFSKTWRWSSNRLQNSVHWQVWLSKVSVNASTYVLCVC